MQQKDTDREKQHEARTAAWETMQETVPPLLEPLADEFRRILGVTEERGAA